MSWSALGRKYRLSSSAIGRIVCGKVVPLNHKQDERYEVIIECRNQGMTLAQIGRRFNITRQRVYEIIQEHGPGRINSCEMQEYLDCVGEKPRCVMCGHPASRVFCSLCHFKVTALRRVGRLVREFRQGDVQAGLDAVDLIHQNGLTKVDLERA